MVLSKPKFRISIPQIITSKPGDTAMDHRFRKVEVRIKGIFVPILNLNLRQVEEMREESEISIKKQSDVKKILAITYSEYYVLRSLDQMMTEN